MYMWQCLCVSLGCVTARVHHLNTVGYSCPLKEVNEQTTAASITDEQEHEEWEENESDEEKRKGALLVLIWASAVSEIAQHLK